jgi:hypothetical protein
MEAGLIRLLTRTTEGKLYTRRAEVEAEILELLSLTRDEQMKRFEIRTASDAGYVSPEALVYFLRDTARDNHEGRFRALFNLVMSRYLAYFRQPEAQRGQTKIVDGALADLRSRARDRFVEKILLDRDAGDDRLDIYEVVFGLAASRDRRSARKAIARRLDREEPLNAADDDRELSPEVERAVANLAIVPAASNSDVGDDRRRILAAIDTLSDKYRRVATMTLENIPVESIDPDKTTISKSLGCTPKTARARQAKAVELIRVALGLEASS